MQKREEVFSSSLFFFIFQNYCIKKDPFFPYADSLMFPLINQSRYFYLFLSYVSRPFSITYNMLLCELISLFYTLYQVIPFFSSFFRRFSIFLPAFNACFYYSLWIAYFTRKSPIVSYSFLFCHHTGNTYYLCLCNKTAISFMIKRTCIRNHI